MKMTSNEFHADGEFWFGDTRVAVRVSSRDGGDQMSVIEHWMPYGEAPPRHVHRNEDEIFVILRGEMLFRVGDSELVGRAGDTVLAPKGIPHQFRVRSAEGAHCFTITRGADFETMVRETGRPAAGPGLPEPTPVTADLVARLTEACGRNGIDIVGPPLG